MTQRHFNDSMRQLEKSSERFEAFADRAHIDGKEPGCCEILGILCGVFRCIGCFVCPPIPEIMARKAAFRPPKRGLSYQIAKAKQPGIKNAKQAKKLTNWTIRWECMNGKSKAEQNLLAFHAPPFIVKTSNGEYLIAIRIRPVISTRTDVVAIFAHPNASDLGTTVQPLLGAARLLNCVLYAFDYAGFGCSTGIPSEANIYSDIRAVYGYVRKLQPNKKIVLIGFSMGTAACVDLAASRPEGLAGVALLAPFTSGLRLMNNEPTRERACCLDRFRSVDKASDIDVPVLVIHGTKDQQIPLSHGQAIHARLRHPVEPFWMPNADHVRIFATTEVWHRIRRFLDEELHTRTKPK